MKTRMAISRYLGLLAIFIAPAVYAESATDVSPICTTVSMEHGPRTLLSRGSYCQRSGPIERTLVAADGSHVGFVEIEAFAYSDNPLDKLSWDVKFRFRTKVVADEWTGLKIKPFVECGSKCSVTSAVAVNLVPGGLSDEVSVTITPNMGGDNPLRFQPLVLYRTARPVDSIESGPSAVFHEGYTYVPTIRCDVDLARKGTKGCVYPEAPAVFRALKTTDPEVDESAQHIKEAQAEGLPGKYVAREDGSILPDSRESKRLKRTRDIHLIKRNRRESLKQCIAKFGEIKEPCTVGDTPDTELTACDCDEYPFVSTQEGAAQANVSVKRISSGDNRLTGMRLGNFFTSQRVLDEEDFYINIDE